MAPNKRGAPPASVDDLNGNVMTNGSVITKEEVEARGSGTNEQTDTYDFSRPWYSEKRVFFTGLMFLTRLPCPGWCDHHPAYLMRSLQYFPIIGAVVGLWAAAWVHAAAVLWPAPIAVAASTLATVWITGCFHEDGLADTFDGFGGGWAKYQILRIMKDSRVGTYALVGVSLVLAMKLRCLELLLVNNGNENENGSGTTAAAALIAAHAASRWTSLPLLYVCDYIQDEDDAKRGLYNWFAQSQRLLTPPRLIIGTASAIAIPWIALGLAQASLIYATILAVTIMAGYYGTAVIGGVVGDFLGATIQVAELACYMVLAADWSKVQENWQPLATLAVVAALPVIYCRRIIDYGKNEC